MAIILRIYELNDQKRAKVQKLNSINKCIMNPKLKNYKNLVFEVEKYFLQSDDLVYKKRNEIKNVMYKDISWNIKSFKIPNVINKIIYTFFRLSKARRSYEYSMKIIDFVPKPLGYVETYKFGFIHKSYFISKEFKYTYTIRKILDDEITDKKRKLLEEFAKFTYKLHKNNINHLDYSPGNILIKELDDNNFLFKIVDINRMKFENLSIEQRAANFSKLWLKYDDLCIVLYKYTELSNFSYDELLALAIKYSVRNIENEKE